MSALLTAQIDLKPEADDVSPLLEDAKIFYENEEGRYRYLLFSQGWEHITSFLVVQKLVADHEQWPYEYSIAVSNAFYGLSMEYSFDVGSIDIKDNGFLFTLPGWHSYYNIETVLKVFVDMDLNIRYESGFVDE